MKKLKVLSLFSGIGAFEQAFKNVGIPFELVNFCEIDKYPALAYRVMHNVDMSLNIWDVKDVNKYTLRDTNIDVITHGSPCQDFSVAGLGRGGELGSNTRSSDLWQTVRIVSEVLPDYVIWEQVPAVQNKKHKHVYDAYLNRLETLGYNNYYDVLNAVDFGVPQNRKRLFTVSIRKAIDDKTFSFPTPITHNVRLRDLLLPDVSLKYYLNEKQIAKFQYAPNKAYKDKLGNRIRIAGHLNKPSQHLQIHDDEGIAPTMSATDYKDPLKIMVEKVGYLSNDAQANRVYATDGAGATVGATGGGLGAKTGLYIVEATKKGYAEAQDGDGIVLNLIGRARGVVQQQRSPTLQTGSNTGVVLDITDNVEVRPVMQANRESVRSNGRRVKENDEPSFVITRTDRQGVMIEVGTPFEITNINGVGVIVVNNRAYVIRRLVPQECFRLMGFSDEAFYIAAVCGFSDSRLYKMAGNSIVVPVIEAILANLFKE